MDHEVDAALSSSEPTRTGSGSVLAMALVVVVVAAVVGALFAVTDANGRLSGGFGGAWPVQVDGGSAGSGDGERFWMLTYQQMSWIERVQRRVLWDEVGVVHAEPILHAPSASDGEDGMQRSMANAWQSALTSVAVLPSSVPHRVVVADGRAAFAGLLPGDLVVAVDGRPVGTVAEASTALERWVARVADCLRDCTDDLHVDVVGTGTSTEDLAAGGPRRRRVTLPAVVGSRVSVLSDVTADGTAFDFALPYTGPDPAVTFGPARAGAPPVLAGVAFDRVSGPSAGLAFALAYTSDLVGGALAPGRSVAATGIIAADGTVRPVLGVTEKLAAAAQAGADVVFVPAGNAAEAASAPDAPGTVVAVSSLADALAWLCSHGGDRAACGALTSP